MIGKKNSDFVLRYLANEGLRVVAADLGGGYGRRIHYHPASGKVERLFLIGASEKRAAEEERRYQAVAADSAGRRLRSAFRLRVTK